MSAGSFVASKYESDGGSIHYIALQQETIDASLGGTTNDEPAGSIDSPFAAEVNRGARSYGLKPRKATVKFEDSPPTGYRPYTTLQIPILTPGTFSDIEIGDSVTYSGGTGEVTGKTAENIRPGAAVIPAATVPAT